MQLSDEIINAFVKTLPNGEKDNSNGYELYYGTVKVSNGKTSVILDGSSIETPLNYLTMGAENGDRVTCIIKDHSLIVTGNLTHPSEGMTTKYIETMTVLAQEAAIGKLIATEGDFTELTADSAFVKRLMSDQVGASILTADEAFVGSLQTKIVTADKIKAMQAEIGYVDADTLEANYIDANTIKANYVDTKTLQANYIDAETIKANYVDTETLKANYVNIKTLESNYIDANTIKANYVDTKTLQANYIDAKTLRANYIDANTIRANYVDINTLHSNYIDADTLKANYVDTKTLKANYMDAVTIKAGYLQADMSNLKIVEATRASIATLLADIALIKNATISQGHITGALDSVTLNANNITAGSLNVDRLYINGSDGKPRLVKFDSSGKPVATTIDASILTDRTVTADKIVANSITANEISTDFLTAFRADIMQTVTEHLEAIDAEIQNLISGDTTISSLTVKSNASVGGKLTVTGSTILKGSVTMNSTLNVDGALTAKSLKLATPLPETSGGTGVNNFNNLFKVFRDRDYRLKHAHTNLLNPTAKTQTKNGVTLTNNGDGTYTLNGTASEWTFFNLNYVNSSTLTIPVGTYKLTGTPTNNSHKVYTQVMTPDKAIGTNQYDYDGTIFTVQQGTAATWVRIAIDKGTTANNLLFKPMITTDLNATYGDFVQYSGDGELNENVAEIYKVSERVSDETHTNLLNPTAQTQTVNSVTFTNNGDGTYTVNGTASAEALIVQPNNLDLTSFRDKDIKIVGCPSGGGANKYQFNINIYNTSGTNIGSAVDFGKGKICHVPSDAHDCNIVMVVRKGQTANNLLFKPMLTTDLNATYNDFVRYSGSGELNKNVAEMYVNKQNKTDNALATNNKTIVGAINGIHMNVQYQYDKALKTTAKYIVGAINELFSNKVNKVTGKGLSTNDYTTDEKNKLAGIAAGAQVNSVTGVKGDWEPGYKTGNVNLTALNVGALNKSGDSITGGWLDWYFHNTLKLSIYANLNDNNAYIHARRNELYIFAQGGGVGIKKDGGGWQNLYAVIQNVSSRLVKDNIKYLTDEDGQKVLDLKPVYYDYADWYSDQKNQLGLIAEEVLEVFPELVTIPDGYDENNIDKEKGTDNKVPSLNYTGFIAPIIKLCQSQQKQIDALSEEVAELRKIVDNIS